MADICPAILAADPHEYREQVERVGTVATRLHIDLTDGRFASAQTVGLERIWCPDGVKADLHLMYQQPHYLLDKILRLKPHLVIVHAEADGDFATISSRLRAEGIKAGVALEQNTPVSVLKGSEHLIDHVLIFSGDLGHFGGRANLALLGKVGEVKALGSAIEVGWDGGINDENIKTIAHSGVEVFNVGGFIQSAAAPQEAYAKLEAAIREADLRLWDKN